MLNINCLSVYESLHQLTSAYFSELIMIHESQLFRADIIYTPKRTVTSLFHEQEHLGTEFCNLPQNLRAGTCNKLIFVTFHELNLHFPLPIFMLFVSHDFGAQTTSSDWFWVSSLKRSESVPHRKIRKNVHEIFCIIMQLLHNNH